MVISITSFSKTFSYKHFSVDEGLPSNRVYCCAQDSLGYMWFGTENGVARFDGNEFKVYTTKSGLEENFITVIHVDRTGRIWFVSYEGLLCYFENQKFTPYRYNNVLKNQLKNSFIKQISITAEKLFFYTYTEGSFSIDKLGKIERVSDDYLSIVEIDDQLVSFCDRKYPKSNYISLKGLKKDKFEIKLPKSQAEFSFFQSIKVSTLNELYISINKTLYKYTDESFQKIFTAQKPIFTIKLIEEQIWLGTARSGIVILSPEKNTLHSSNFLGSLGIREIFVDKEKSTWIVSDEDGVYFIPSTKHFVLTQEDGISSNNVSKMVASKKSLIWVDLAGPINELIMESNKINVLRENENTWLYDITYNPYEDKFIIIQDKPFKGKKINKAKYKVIETFELYLAVDTNYYSTVQATGKGFKLTQYKREKVFTQLFPTHETINWWNIKCVHYKDGLVFIGTDKGLYSLPISMNDSISKPIYLGDYHPIFKNKIVDIDENANQDLFFVSKNKGIITLKNGTLGVINKSYGLASNNITSIFIDSSSTIWVSTLNGVSVIDTNEIINNLRTQDGLISNQTNSIFANSEYIYIGTDKGLSVLDRKHLKNDTIDIPVQIKSIFLENQNQILVQNNSINLNFHTPTLEINFVGISFKSMGRIKYKYRLNTQENWQYTNNTQLTFINLASGEYNLEIYATNDNKNWSTEPARLHIQVAYPFWRTNWFIILSAFGLSFILFGIYRFALTRIKKREEIKRQVQNLRFEALNAQMNPHFIFNSLNSVQHFIMTNDKRESTRYLSKFAKLMRKTLDHSREKNVSLHEELEALELYLELEALRFDNLITYQIEVDKKINTSRVILPALLIQPIVENAILHGIRPNANGGHISISILSKNSMLYISIIDNGIGREAALLNKGKGHNSKGGILTKERVSLFAKEYNSVSNYEIIDLKENRKPAGTEVRINLPLILKANK